MNDIHFEMGRLDKLFKKANLEKGTNHNTNKKVLAQLNICIECYENNPSTTVYDIGSGKSLDIDYLKLQRKQLVNFMQYKK